MEPDNVNRDTSVAQMPGIASSLRMDLEWRGRIKTARRQAGKMTQEQLAEAIGKSQSSVASYESEGGNEPSLAEFMKIAEATAVSPVWLVFGEGAVANEPAAPEPMDRRLMEQIIEGAERRFAIRKTKLMPSAKARLILGIYELIVHAGDRLAVEGELDRLIKPPTK